MAKDNIVFYRQWWESIRELDPETQSKVYDALMRFAFEGIEPTDAIARAVTTPMRPTIIRDREKYERICERNRANGGKGGAPKGNNNARRTTTENNPNQPKTTHSVVFEIESRTPEPVIVDIAPDVSPPTAVTVPDAKTDLEQQFDAFRKRYPGTKRGFKIEFDNFKKKNPKTWREIIPLLAPALDRLIEWHERRTAAGQFAPNYKNLATWLNQQCWTEELPEIIENPITPRNTVTNPINHGNIDRQSEFARHIIDKLTTPDRPEPDISGNY